MHLGQNWSIKLSVSNWAIDLVIRTRSLKLVYGMTCKTRWRLYNHRAEFERSTDKKLVAVSTHELPNQRTFFSFWLRQSDHYFDQFRGKTARSIVQFSSVQDVKYDTLARKSISASSYVPRSFPKCCNSK